MEIGLVCDACSALSPLGAPACGACGAGLDLASRREAEEVPMDKGAILCPQCGSPVPPEHRFCGKCGGKIEPPATVGRTMYFGAMQAPGRAKLILIKGEGLDGVAYHLNATEHVVGRSEGAILFPEDPLLSPRHCNFFYREGRLHVSDEGSANGVFIRIRNPVTVDSGTMFLAGEQLLQVEACAPDMGPQPDAEGTYFYASPRRPSKLKVIQRLRGGDIGMIHRARADTVTIGRSGNDIDFPEDPFLSSRHAQVAAVEGRFVVTDLGSKNGSFVRIADETSLDHGDYVFVGQQLLRVEVV